MVLKSVAGLLVSLIACLACVSSVYAVTRYQKVKVVEPFLELRTGAGRLFPVFHVVEKDEWVEIHRRRTDWFRVRTEDGIEGWVNRSQIEKTVTVDGTNKQVKETILEQYLQQRAEFGFVYGQLEKSPLIGVHGTWKMSDHFSLELSFSQASALFSTTRLTSLNLLSHPFSSWRIAPYFSLGAGRLRQSQTSALIAGNAVEAWTANVALGIRSYLTRNFIIRAYVRQTNAFVDDPRTKTYLEPAIGISFFF